MKAIKQLISNEGIDKKSFQGLRWEKSILNKAFSAIGSPQFTNADD